MPDGRLAHPKTSTGVPGMEPRNIKVFLEMIMRLVSNKQDGKRRIESTDLELPWQPLWRVLKKELWPKGRARSTRSAKPRFLTLIILTR